MGCKTAFCTGVWAGCMAAAESELPAATVLPVWRMPANFVRFKLSALIGGEIEQSPS